MTDIEYQRVLNNYSEDSWIDDNLYLPYDPNFHYQEIPEMDPLRTTTNSMTNHYLLSDSEYQYTRYLPCGTSDLDDSHESDDSSVMLDPEELNQIEMYEQEEERFSQTSHYPSTLSSLSHTYQPNLPSQQSGTILPAFDTLFPPRKNNNSSLTRLPTHGSMSDSDDDEESNSICRKGKRGAKNVLLWKFLLEELKKGKHVEWTDISQGTFRFVDTTEISRLWGNMKRKEDMNFEKLSRGIRHYYKSGFMSRQEGTRLIYRFNWHKVPKKFRQFDPKRGVTINSY